MRVKIEFVIDTSDYGKKEFKKEIENLIKDIDPSTKLIKFDMREIIVFKK